MSDGWYRPWGAHKYHYFKQGRSLCRKWRWGYFPSLSRGNPVDTEKCVPCVKKTKPREPHVRRVSSYESLPLRRIGDISQPISTEAFSAEAWRRYWMGKTPKVRYAVEDYIARFRTPNQETQGIHCERHGITEAVLRRHLKALVKAGLLLAKETP